MGFRIIKEITNIDFIGLWKWAFGLSWVLILIGFGSIFFKGGLKYGIDFAGGVLVQVKFVQSIDDATVKKSLESANLQGLSVQQFGQASENEFLLRISGEKMTTDAVRTQVEQALVKALPGKSYSIQRLEMVGPKVGADLRFKALQAIFYSILFMAIYISGRFEHRWFAAAAMAGAISTGVYLLGLLNVPLIWLVLAATIIALGLCWFMRLRYAIGAFVALIHDVLITVGLLSILNKEIDLTIIAALLTLVGYSLNDSIIIYDRIRENNTTKAAPTLLEIINLSINQTLSRTILTGGTVLMAVAALFFWGGGVIHDFALTMLVGVLVGTYSSIYVSSPILLLFEPKTVTN